ncbi:MAG: hypothetical protein SGILL_006117 [Bacillariaceae sp.]
MFYSQVILAKKGPLAKVWLAAHWGDKKLARPQIFATDISQSCTDIMNPSVPLALRLSGHLLLGVVRIYSRKVKYVLNDCTEAMLKLQMAFTKSGGGNAGGDKELLTDQDAPTNNLVANFGEYDQVHVVEGFCLPLPEDNEWILAEDEEDDAEGSQQSAGRQALLLAQLPQASQGRNSGSPGFPGPQEETWAPFDPDNEDEDDDDVDPRSGSRVSDIEMVRAANDSLLSEDQTRRASSILDDKDLPGMEGAKDQREEPDDDFNMPFADDSEDEQGPAGARGELGFDESMLQLSRDGDASGLNRSNLSGLEDSPSSKRTREDEKPRKKRRKRRKVVIDNHNTELSNEHIRNMLKDTDDIVRKMVHPAVWDGEESENQPTLKRGEKPKLPSLTSSFLADEADRKDAYLHPRLRKLWEDSYWRALGNPCPFKRRDVTDDDVDSIENVRREKDVDDSKAEDTDDEIPFANDNEDNKQEPDDFNFPQPDDSDDEDEPVDAPPMDMDSDASSLQHGGNDGDLELGMVNDMAVDSDDEDRQAAGEEASSNSKWHKHTIRVFQHLKKCMKDPDQPADDMDDDEEASELPEQVQFDEITKNVHSRRNAASVFFEILQLKTWDFIEVDQEDAYGDITISPGVRFSEDVPN